jgi:hypothetical protein
MKMDILKCPKQVFASEFGRQKTHIWNLPLIAVDTKYHSAFFSVLDAIFRKLFRHFLCYPYIG